MLRIYFLQQWFNLSDPAVEGIRRRVPDEEIGRHQRDDPARTSVLGISDTAALYHAR
jgi:hypothetical protein